MIAASGSQVHPILLPSSDGEASVLGVVLTVSPADLAAADAYEVSDYTRIRVPLRSGRQAWVYVFAGEGR